MTLRLFIIIFTIIAPVGAYAEGVEYLTNDDPPIDFAQSTEHSLNDQNLYLGLPKDDPLNIVFAHYLMGTRPELNPEWHAKAIEEIVRRHPIADTYITENYIATLRGVVLIRHDFGVAEFYLDRDAPQSALMRVAHAVANPMFPQSGLDEDALNLVLQAGSEPDLGIYDCFPSADALKLREFIQAKIAARAKNLEEREAARAKRIRVLPASFGSLAYLAYANYMRNAEEQESLALNSALSLAGKTSCIESEEHASISGRFDIKANLKGDAIQPVISETGKRGI